MRKPQKLKIGRRRFIEYGAILSLGAGAAYLGYSQLSKGISSPSLTSTATSAGTSTDSANLSPAYSQFLAWLASVSKPYTGRTIDVSLQYEPTPLAIQAIDPQFFNATGINV